MDLDAIALAELRGGGAKLVARDAAAGADLVLKKMVGAREKGQIPLAWIAAGTRECRTPGNRRCPARKKSGIESFCRRTRKRKSLPRVAPCRDRGYGDQNKHEPW